MTKFTRANHVSWFIGVKVCAKSDHEYVISVQSLISFFGKESQIAIHESVIDNTNGLSIVGNVKHVEFV